MSNLNVTKQLIVQEDIAYGEGVITQARGGVNVDVNQVRTIVPVNSLVELNALDTTKFTKAILFSGTAVTIYNYYSGAWNKGTSEVQTLNELRSMPAVAGMSVTVKGHTSFGIGGGNFDTFNGTVVDDNGDKIPSITPNVYFKRRNPKKDLYEFGYLDGAANASVAINSCTLAYGECNLDAGKTYNIQYEIKPLTLQCQGGVATLNCTSPTSNTRFGSLNAAVYALGGVGAPLSGVKVINVNINCNKLIGVTGSVGLKGYLFQRCKNFFQAGCTVTNCASYGFWDYDTSATGTTYCSGTRNDCNAIDCAVSFEQVNVRGVTLNNCNAYTSVTLSGYSVEAQFHFYGGSDMQITYNNCRGIADGPCPVIVLALLESKNININDCIFINNYNLGPGNITAAFYADNASGNFDNINFKNTKLISTYSTAVYVLPGSVGTTTNKWTFQGCVITGIQIGVQFAGTGGRYIFDDCDISASAPNPIVPFAMYNNATNPIVQIRNGFVTATGPAVSANATNLTADSFLGVLQTPAGAVLPTIRQQVVGKGVVVTGGTFGSFDIVMTSAVTGWTSSSNNTTKLSVVCSVDYGISLAADGTAAAGMAYMFSHVLQTNQIVRVVLPVAAVGKTIRYLATEYN